MTRQDRIEQALAYLVRLIASGWEYPDAENKAADKFGLNSAERNDLRRDYDNR